MPEMLELDDVYVIDQKPLLVVSVCLLMLYLIIYM